MGGTAARRCAASPEMPLAIAGAGAGGLRYSALAPLLALLSCVLYCLNGELLQALQRRGSTGEGHPSPLLNLVLCHLGGLVFAPRFLGMAPPLRTVQAGFLSELAERPKLASLVFSFLLMGYNCAWLASSSFLDASLTNAVFQTSIALIYLASVLLFGEPVTLLRFAGVLLSVAGSALACGGSLGRAAQDVPLLSMNFGLALALVASVGNTVYQVLFRKLFGHLKHDVSFLAHFGAWVSIWHVLVIAPLVLLAHLCSIERLEFPSGWFAVTGTLASAAIASTVNALYLCIVMWGSPMLLPCSSALSVPLTVVLDAELHGLRPGLQETVGHVMVVLSVVLIMELQRAVRVCTISATDRKPASVLDVR